MDGRRVEGLKYNPNANPNGRAAIGTERVTGLDEAIC